jgi:hypothetical protein
MHIDPLPKFAELLQINPIALWYDAPPLWYDTSARNLHFLPFLYIFFTFAQLVCSLSPIDFLELFAGFGLATQ